MADEQIDVAWVPGAFEIPTVAGRLAADGATRPCSAWAPSFAAKPRHDQHINRAVSIALAELGARYGLPVLFGVLTCDTLEQAIARSGGQTATTGKDHGRQPAGQQGRRLRRGRPGNGRPAGETARSMKLCVASSRCTSDVPENLTGNASSDLRTFAFPWPAAAEHEKSPSRSCIKTI